MYQRWIVLKTTMHPTYEPYHEKIVNMGRIISFSVCSLGSISLPIFLCSKLKKRAVFFINWFTVKALKTDFSRTGATKLGN